MFRSDTRDPYAAPPCVLGKLKHTHFQMCVCLAHPGFFSTQKTLEDIRSLGFWKRRWACNITQDTQLVRGRVGYHTLVIFRRALLNLLKTNYLIYPDDVNVVCRRADCPPLCLLSVDESVLFVRRTGLRTLQLTVRRTSDVAIKSRELIT
jgi:hypothetical protein